MGPGKALGYDNSSWPSTTGWALAAGVAAAGWALGTAEFAAARILPGPRDRREVATMLATSVAIPPVAVGHWAYGWWKWRDAGERRPANDSRRPAEVPA